MTQEMQTSRQIWASRRSTDIPESWPICVLERKPPWEVLAVWHAQAHMRIGSQTVLLFSQNSARRCRGGLDIAQEAVALRSVRICGEKKGKELLGTVIRAARMLKLKFYCPEISMSLHG
jgi:hypothetical protein